MDSINFTVPQSNVDSDPVAVFCSNPRQFASVTNGTCPGFCINQDMNNMPAIIAFVLSSAASSLAMCYMTSKDKRRHQYHLHSIQIWSRIALVFVSYAIKKTSNSFDIAMTVVLAVGAEITALLGSVKGLNLTGYHRFVLFVKHILSTVAIIIAAILAMPFVNKDIDGKIQSAIKSLRIPTAGLGSQPECSLPGGWLTAEPWLMCGVLLVIWVVVGLSYLFRGHSDDKGNKFWLTVISVANIAWVVAITLFVVLTPRSLTILNKNTWNVTVGQLFSIFLSLSTSLPVIKHLVEKFLQFFEIMEKEPGGSELADLKNSLESKTIPFGGA